MSATSFNNSESIPVVLPARQMSFFSNFSDVSKTYFSQFMIFKPIYIPIEYQ